MSRRSKPPGKPGTKPLAEPTDRPAPAATDGGRGGRLRPGEGANTTHEPAGTTELSRLIAAGDFAGAIELLDREESVWLARVIFKATHYRLPEADVGEAY